MSAELVVLWLHVLAAIAWIGGMVFVAAVLAPIARTMPEGERTALFGAVGRRLSRLGWGSIALLLVTGVGNVVAHVPNLEFLAGSRAAPWLALKLLFVVCLLGLSCLHDFVYGPRQVAYSAALRAGRGTAAMRDELGGLRRRVRLIAQINLVLGLSIVLIGVALRYLW